MRKLRDGETVPIKSRREHPNAANLKVYAAAMTVLVVAAGGFYSAKQARDTARHHRILDERAQVNAPLLTAAHATVTGDVISFGPGIKFYYAPSAAPDPKQVAYTVPKGQEVFGPHLNRSLVAKNKHLWLGMVVYNTQIPDGPKQPKLSTSQQREQQLIWADLTAATEAEQAADKTHEKDDAVITDHPPLDLHTGRSQAARAPVTISYDRQHNLFENTANGTQLPYAGISWVLPIAQAEEQIIAFENLP